jgi:hypothetical protein
MSDLYGNDYVDLREVWERKEALETAQEQHEEGDQETDCPTCDEDAATELAELTQFFAEESQESEPYSRGEFNEPTLILDSYFQEYAQELAEDIGAIDKDATWPNNCIDWEHACRELKYDYTSVTFGGYEYWVRSY